MTKSLRALIFPRVSTSLSDKPPHSSPGLPNSPESGSSQSSLNARIIPQPDYRPSPSRLRGSTDGDIGAFRFIVLLSCRSAVAVHHGQKQKVGDALERIVFPS